MTWTALGSGLLDVDRVQIVGATKLSEAPVRAVASGALGDPMLTLNADRLRDRLAQIPAVASAEVSRSWSGTLQVRITERRAVLAVRRVNGWELVDRTGVPFTTQTQRPRRLLSLAVDKPGANDPATQAALAVLAVLPHRVRKDVVGIQAPSPAGVRLELRRGATVVWGGPEDAEHKAAALAALLHTKAHVYDVSTPGVATTS